MAGRAEIEERTRKVLLGHFPGYRFYGEEGGEDEAAPPGPGDRRFLVDPLDGTRNFLNRRQEFCTAIACQEWTAGGWVTTDGVVRLTPAQLSMLLEGIDWRAPIRTDEPPVRALRTGDTVDRRASVRQSEPGTRSMSP